MKPMFKEMGADGARVAPLAGAWIETATQKVWERNLRVAPLAGAWIETYPRDHNSQLTESHPSRVRGLKH